MEEVTQHMTYRELQLKAKKSIRTNDRKSYIAFVNLVMDMYDHDHITYSEAQNLHVYANKLYH